MKIIIGSLALAVTTCRFRLRPYALRYGGYGGHGTSYQWLGVSLKIGRV